MSYITTIVRAILAVMITVGAVTTHAQSTSGELPVGSVVVRRTASGDRWRDSVTSRAGARTDYVRTTFNASGALLSREGVIVEDSRAGSIERTSSRELLVLPRPARPVNATYPCGYVVAASLRCTELTPEFVTLPSGPLRTRRVLVTADHEGSEPAFTEVWISTHGIVVRSRARSSETDADLETEAFLPPRRIAETTPVRHVVEQESSVDYVRSARRSSRTFIEVGGAMGKRWLSIPAINHSGHDRGLGATASIGVFLTPHVAVVVSGDAYRTSARGDMLPEGWVTYPSERFEELVHLGVGLRLNAQRSRGAYLRVTGGISSVRERLFAVAARTVVGSHDYEGRGASVSAAIGHDFVAGHMAFSPYVSAIHVMQLDKFTRSSRQLAWPATRHTAVQAGLTLGLR